jgi:hypothetical protein
MNGVCILSLFGLGGIKLSQIFNKSGAHPASGVGTLDTAKTSMPIVDTAEIGVFSDIAGITDPLLRNLMITALDTDLQGSVFSPKACATFKTFLTEGASKLSQTEVTQVTEMLQFFQRPEAAELFGLSFEHMQTLYNCCQDIQGNKTAREVAHSKTIRDGAIADLGIGRSELDFRRMQYLISPDSKAVSDLTSHFLATGAIHKGMSAEDIGLAVLGYVQKNYQYRTDMHGDKWQTVSQTMALKGGDCEDLTVLTASLLMKTLEKVGYSSDTVREMVTLSAGFVRGKGGSGEMGHTLVTLSTENGVKGLDATATGGFTDLNAIRFDRLFEMNDQVFNSFKSIPDYFQTALRLRGDVLNQPSGTPMTRFDKDMTKEEIARLQFASVADAINFRSDQLTAYLSRPLDIPRVRFGKMYRMLVNQSLSPGASVRDLEAQFNAYKATAMAGGTATLTYSSGSQFKNYSMTASNHTRFTHLKGESIVAYSGTKSSMIAEFGSSNGQYRIAKTNVDGSIKYYPNGDPVLVSVSAAELANLRPGDTIYKIFNLYDDVNLSGISTNTLYNSFDKTSALDGLTNHANIEEFEFFNIKKVDVPFKNDTSGDMYMYMVEIKEQQFYNYISNVMDQINQITSLFRSVFGLLEMIHAESEEMSAMHLDEQTRQDLKDNTYRNYLQKFAEEVDKFQSKIGTGIRDLSNELFNFISSTNDAEEKRATMLIDIWPRKGASADGISTGQIVSNVLTGITGTLADEWTGALTLERATAKKNLNEAKSLIVARNAQARARLSYSLTLRIDMWSDPDEPQIPDYETSARSNPAFLNGWTESVWRAQDFSTEGTAQQLAYGGVSKGELLAFLRGVGGEGVRDGGIASAATANSEIGQMLRLVKNSDFNPANPSISPLYWIQSELSNIGTGERARIETVQNAADETGQFKAKLFNLASDKTTQSSSASPDVGSAPIPSLDQGQQREKDRAKLKNDLKEERERLTGLVTTYTQQGRDTTVERNRITAIGVALEENEGIPQLIRQRATHTTRLNELLANPGLESPPGETQIVRDHITRTTQQITDARARIALPYDPARPDEKLNLGADAMAQFNAQLPASGRPTMPPDLLSQSTSSGYKAYLDFNAPRTLEIKNKLVSYQNFLRVSLLVKQLMMDNIRQAAEALTEKQGSAVLGAGNRVASQALEAELNVQFSHFDAAFGEMMRLNDSINELVIARFEYYKASQRVALSVTRTTAQLAVETTSIIIGAIMEPVGKIAGYDKPYFSYMLNTIGGAAIESAMTLWDLGIEYNVREFYKPSVIQTYDNPYNAQFGRRLKNESLAYQNSSGTIVTGGDPTSIKGIFTLGSPQQDNYLENRFNQLRLSAQINFGGGGEKTFYNVNQETKDVVPDFVTSRGDGFYSKDSYDMFFRIGPGGYNPNALGKHGIDYNPATDGTSWADFNKIKLMSYLFYAVLNHMQNAAKEMSGVAGKSNFAQFESQIDAYLNYERSVITTLKSEVDAVIRAATVNANKDKKRETLKDDAAMGAVKIPLSLLSMAKEPLNRFLYSAASIPVEQADLLRKRAGMQYAGLNANYRNPNNQTLAAGIAGMPSVDRSAPNSPFSSSGGVDPTAHIFDLESLENTPGGLGALNEQSVRQLVDTVNAYYENKSNISWFTTNDGPAVSPNQATVDLKHQAATLARWINWENDEKKLMQDFYKTNQDNPYQPTSLPMTSVNFFNAIEATQDLAKIGALRIILLMALQMLHKQKQNVLKEMTGFASQANMFQRSMNIIDRYNSFQADAMDDLVQEFTSRSEANNVFQTELLALSVEAPSVAAISAAFFLYPKKFIGDPAEGGGDKYVNMYKRIVAGQIAKILAQAVGNTTIALIGLLSEKQTPTMRSDFLTYQHSSNEDKEQLKQAKDRKAELEDKKAKGTATGQDLKDLDATNARISTLQKKVVMGNSNASQRRRGDSDRTDLGINKGQIQFVGGGTVLNTAIQQQAKTKVERAARRVEIINSIVAAQMGAQSDVASDMSGVDSAKMFRSFSSVLSRIKQGQLAAVGLMFQSLQSVADQRNQNLEKLTKAIVDIVTQGAKVALMRGQTKVRKQKEAAQRSTKEGTEKAKSEKDKNQRKIERKTLDNNDIKGKMDQKKTEQKQATTLKEKFKIAKERRQLKKEYKKNEAEIAIRTKHLDKQEARIKTAEETNKKNVATNDKNLTELTRARSELTNAQAQIASGAQPTADVAALTAKVKAAEAEYNKSNNMLKFGSERDPGATRSPDKMNETSRDLFRQETAFRFLEKINSLISHVIADMLISTAAPSMVDPGNSSDQGATNAFSMASDANLDKVRVEMGEGQGALHDVANALGTIGVIPTAELENAILGAKLDAGTYAAMAKVSKSQERFFKVMSAILKSFLEGQAKTAAGINESQMAEFKREVEQRVLSAILAVQNSDVKGKNVSYKDVLDRLVLPTGKGIMTPLGSDLLKRIIQTEINSHDRGLAISSGIKNAVFGTGKNLSDISRDLSLKGASKRVEKLSNELAALNSDPQKNAGKIAELEKKLKDRTNIVDLGGEIKKQEASLRLMLSSEGYLPSEKDALEEKIKALKSKREADIKSSKFDDEKVSKGAWLLEAIKRRGFLGMLPVFSTFRSSDPLPGYRELKERRQGQEYMDRIMFAYTLPTNAAILNNEKDTFNAFSTTDPLLQNFVVNDQRADLKLIATGSAGNNAPVKLLHEKLLLAHELFTEQLKGSQFKDIDPNITQDHVNALVSAGLIAPISLQKSDADKPVNFTEQNFRVLYKRPDLLAALEPQIVADLVAKGVKRGPIDAFFQHYKNLIFTGPNVESRALIASELNSLETIRRNGIFTATELADSLAKQGLSPTEAKDAAASIIKDLKDKKYIEGDSTLTFTRKFYKRRFRNSELVTQAREAGKILELHEGKDPLTDIINKAVRNNPGSAAIATRVLMETSISQGGIFDVASRIKGFLEKETPQAANGLKELLSQFSAIDSSARIEDRAMGEMKNALRDALIAERKELLESSPVLKAAFNSNGAVVFNAPEAGTNAINDKTIPIVFNVGSNQIIVQVDPSSNISIAKIKEALEEQKGETVTRATYQSLSALGPVAPTIFAEFDDLLDQRESLLSNSTLFQPLLDASKKSTQEIKQLNEVLNAFNSIRGEIAAIESLKKAELFMMSNLKTGDIKSQLEDLLSQQGMGSAEVKSMLQELIKNYYITEEGKLTSDAGFTAPIDEITDLFPGLSDSGKKAITTAFLEQRRKETLLYDINTRGGQDKESVEKLFGVKTTLTDVSSQLKGQIALMGTPEETRDFSSALDQLNTNVDTYIASNTAMAKEALSRISLVVTGLPGVTVDEALDKVLTVGSPGAFVAGVLSMIPIIGSLDWAGLRSSGVNWWRDAHWFKKDTHEEDRVTGSSSRVSRFLFDRGIFTRNLTPDNRRLIENASRMEEAGINPNDLKRNLNKFLGDEDVASMVQLMTMGLKDIFDFDSRDATTKFDIERTIFDGVQNAVDQINKIFLDSAPDMDMQARNEMNGVDPRTIDKANVRKAALLMLKLGEELLKYAGSTPEMSNRYLGLILQELERQHPDKFKSITTELIELSDSSASQETINRLLGVFSSNETRFFKNIANRAVLTDIPIIGSRFATAFDGGFDRGDEADLTMRSVGLNPKQMRGREVLESLFSLDNIGLLVSRLTGKDFADQSGFVALRTDSSLRNFLLHKLISDFNSAGANSKLRADSGKALVNLSNILGEQTVRQTLAHSSGDLSTLNAILTNDSFKTDNILGGYLSSSSLSDGFKDVGRGTMQSLNSKALSEKVTVNPLTGVVSGVELEGLLKELTLQLQGDAAGTTTSLAEQDNLINLSILLKNAVRANARDAASDFVDALFKTGKAGQEVRELLTDTFLDINANLYNKNVQNFVKKATDDPTSISTDRKALSEKVSAVASETISSKRHSLDSLRLLQSDAGQQYLKETFTAQDKRDKLAEDLAKTVAAALANRVQAVQVSSTGDGETTFAANLMLSNAIKAIENASLSLDERDQLLDKFARDLGTAVDVANTKLADPVKISLSTLIDYAGAQRDRSTGLNRFSEILRRNGNIRGSGMLASQLRQIDTANIVAKSQANLVFTKALTQSPAALQSTLRTMVTGGDRQAAITLIRNRAVNPSAGNDYTRPLSTLISSVSTAITPRSTKAEGQSVEVFYHELIRQLKEELGTSTDVAVKASLTHLISTAEKEYKSVIELNGRTRFAEHEGVTLTRSGGIRDGMALALSGQDSQAALSSLIQSQTALLQSDAPAGHPLHDFSNKFQKLSESSRDLFSTDDTRRQNAEVNFSRELTTTLTAYNALSSNSEVSHTQLAHAQALMELAGLVGLQSSAPLSSSQVAHGSEAFATIVSSSSPTEFSNFLTKANGKNFKTMLTNYINHSPLDDSLMGVFEKISQHTNIADTRAFFPAMVARLENQVSPSVLANANAMSYLKPADQNVSLVSASNQYQIPSSVRSFDQLMTDLDTHFSPLTNPIDQAQLADIKQGLSDSFHLRSGSALEQRDSILNTIYQKQNMRVGSLSADALPAALEDMITTGTTIGRSGGNLEVTQEFTNALARLMVAETTISSSTISDAIKVMRDATNLAEVSKSFSDFVVASGGRDAVSQKVSKLDTMIQTEVKENKSRLDSFVFVSEIKDPELQNAVANFGTPTDTNAQKLSEALQNPLVIAKLKKEKPAQYLKIVTAFTASNSFTGGVHFKVAQDILLAKTPLFRSYQTASTADEKVAFLTQLFSPATNTNTRVEMLSLMNLDGDKFSKLFNNFDFHVTASDFSRMALVSPSSPFRIPHDQLLETLHQPTIGQVVQIPLDVQDGPILNNLGAIDGRFTSADPRTTERNIKGAISAQFTQAFGSITDAERDAVYAAIQPGAAPGAMPALHGLTGPQVRHFLESPFKLAMTSEGRPVDAASNKPIEGVLLSSGALSPRFLNLDGTVKRPELEAQIGAILVGAYQMAPAAATADARTIATAIETATLRPNQVLTSLGDMQFSIAISEMPRSEKESMLQTLNTARKKFDDRTHTLFNEVHEQCKKAQAQFERGNTELANIAISKAAGALDLMIPTLVDGGFNEAELRGLLDGNKTPGERAFNLVDALKKIEDKSQQLNLSPVERRLLVESRKEVSTLLLERLVREPEFRESNKGKLKDFLTSLSSLGETVEGKFKAAGNPVYALMHSSDQSPMLMRQFMSLFDSINDPKLMETLLERSGIFNPSDDIQMSRLVDFMSIHPTGAAGVVNYIGNPAKKAAALNKLMSRDGDIDWTDSNSIVSHMSSIDTVVQALRVVEKPEEFFKYLDIITQGVGSPAGLDLLQNIYSQLASSPMAQNALLDELPNLATRHAVSAPLPAAQADTASADMLAPLQDGFSKLLSLKAASYEALSASGRNFNNFKSLFIDFLQNPAASTDTVGYALFRDLMLNPLHRSYLISMMNDPITVSGAQTTVGQRLLDITKTDDKNSRTLTSLLAHGPSTIRQNATKGVLEKSAATTNPILIYTALMDDFRVSHPLRFPPDMPRSTIESLITLASKDGNLQVVSSLLRFRGTDARNQYRGMTEAVLTEQLLPTATPSARKDALNVLTHLNDPLLAHTVVTEAFKATTFTDVESYRTFLNSTILSPQFMSGLPARSRDRLVSDLMSSLAANTSNSATFMKALSSLYDATTASSAVQASQFKSPDVGIDATMANDIMTELQRRSVIQAPPSGQLSDQYDPTRNVLGLSVNGIALTSQQSDFVNNILQSHYYAQSHGLSDGMKEVILDEFGSHHAINELKMAFSYKPEAEPNLSRRVEFSLYNLHAVLHAPIPATDAAYVNRICDKLGEELKGSFADLNSSSQTQLYSCLVILAQREGLTLLQPVSPSDAEALLSSLPETANPLLVKVLTMFSPTPTPVAAAAAPSLINSPIDDKLLKDPMMLHRYLDQLSQVDFSDPANQMLKLQLTSNNYEGLGKLFGAVTTTEGRRLQGLIVDRLTQDFLTHPIKSISHGFEQMRFLVSNNAQYVISHDSFVDSGASKAESKVIFDILESKGFIEPTGSIKKVISPDAEVAIRHALTQENISKQTANGVLATLKDASKPTTLTRQMVEKMIADGLDEPAEFQAFTRGILHNPSWSPYQKAMILAPIVCQLTSSTTASKDPIIPLNQQSSFFRSVGQSMLDIFNIHLKRPATKRPSLDLLKDLYNQLDHDPKSSDTEVFTQVLAASIRTSGRDYLLRFSDVKTNEARFLRKVLKDDFMYHGGKLYSSLVTTLAQGQDVPSAQDKQLLDIVQRHVDHMAVFDKKSTGNYSGKANSFGAGVNKLVSGSILSGPIGASVRGDVHDALEMQVRKAVDDENPALIESVCRSLALMGLQHQDTSWLNALVLETSTFNQDHFSLALRHALPLNGTIPANHIQDQRASISQDLLKHLASPENGFLTYDPSTNAYYRTSKVINSEADLHLGDALGSIPEGKVKADLMRQIVHDLKAPHLLLTPMIRLSRDEFTAGQARSRRNHLIYNRQGYRFDQISQKPGSKRADLLTASTFTGGPTFSRNYLGEYLHFRGSAGSHVRAMVDDVYRGFEFTEAQGGEQRKSDYYARQLMNTDANELATTITSASRGLTPKDLSQIAEQQVKESLALNGQPVSPDVFKSDAFKSQVTQTSQRLFQSLVTAGYVKPSGELTSKFDPKSKERLEHLPAEFKGNNYELRMLLTGVSDRVQTQKTRANFMVKSLLDPDIELNYVSERTGGFGNRVDRNERLKKINKLQAVTAEMIVSASRLETELATEKAKSTKDTDKIAFLTQKQANLKEQLLYVHQHAPTLFTDVLNKLFSHAITHSDRDATTRLLFGVSHTDYGQLANAQNSAQRIADTFLNSSQKPAQGLKLAEDFLDYLTTPNPAAPADPLKRFELFSNAVVDLEDQPRFRKMHKTGGNHDSYSVLLGKSLDEYAKKHGKVDRKELLFSLFQNDMTSIDEKVAIVDKTFKLLEWSPDKGQSISKQQFKNLLTPSLSHQHMSNSDDVSARSLKVLVDNGIFSKIGEPDGPYELKPSRLHQWNEAINTLINDPKIRLGYAQAQRLKKTIMEKMPETGLPMSDQFAKNRHLLSGQLAVTDSIIQDILKPTLSDTELPDLARISTQALEVLVDKGILSQTGTPPGALSYALNPSSLHQWDDAIDTLTTVDHILDSGQADSLKKSIMELMPAGHDQWPMLLSSLALTDSNGVPLPPTFNANGQVDTAAVKAKLTQLGASRDTIDELTQSLVGPLLEYRLTNATEKEFLKTISKLDLTTLNTKAVDIISSRLEKMGVSNRIAKTVKEKLAKLYTTPMPPPATLAQAQRDMQAAFNQFDTDSNFSKLFRAIDGITV